MMNDKKSPVQKFLEGKGFYIALALCVAGTGTAAWLAVNRTIDDIDDQNQKILESRPQTEDFTDPGEVDAEQNGVTISSEGEDSSSDASSSQEPAAQPSGGSASSVPQNTSALQFSLPVAGEKLNPYSDGKLVKDATLGEWRTHDGRQGHPGLCRWGGHCGLGEGGRPVGHCHHHRPSEWPLHCLLRHCGRRCP